MNLIFYFILLIFIKIDNRKLISIDNGYGISFKSKLKFFENIDTNDIWIVSEKNLIY